MTLTFTRRETKAATAYVCELYDVVVASLGFPGFRFKQICLSYLPTVLGPHGTLEVPGARFRPPRGQGTPGVSGSKVPKEPQGQKIDQQLPKT